MNNQLLLASIFEAINQITFPQKRHTQQARDITRAIFNKHILERIDFNIPIEYSNKYFKTIINNDGDRAIILRELNQSSIIITDGKYFTGLKPIKAGLEAYAKSYILNPELLKQNPSLFTAYIGINKINEKTKIKYIERQLNKIQLDTTVFNIIPSLIDTKIKNNMIIGDDITEKFIKITIGNKTEIKPINYWRAVAKQSNMNVIKYKDKFFIDSVSTFTANKRNSLLLKYNYSLYRLANKDFYFDRNDTNSRLDYNLTTLNADFMPYIVFDGEKTLEIDICNAQFALLANIPDIEMDAIFKEKAMNGTLYNYVSEKLSLKPEEVKQLMMVSNFGKATRQDKRLKELFPILMESIYAYKIKYGFETFSVMLQKAESSLMIDGVFQMLVKNKIAALPVHDSMRVKESDYDLAKSLMEEFFINKGLGLKLKEKK